MDTIFALASAQGRAGVSVIRVSGPEARHVACKLCGSLPGSRGLRKLRDNDGTLVDEVLVLPFEQGRSFTGEDVVEFHTHGSPAIITAVLRLLGDFTGVRPAEPGEFTRRAMLNGRLDLAEVEGLSDLIEAETEAQRRQAMRVFSGDLGRLSESWRKALVRAAALIEATIDFADEEVPTNVYPEVRDLLDRVRLEMGSEAEGVRAAERLRDGFEVAITGKPNVGKSTLLNRLAGRDVAITSEVAGTTRDVIEVKMDLAGFPVTLIDTAGLRETDDLVEGIGVQRGLDRAKMADLRVVLVENENEVRAKSEDELVLVGKRDDHKDGEPGISGKTGAGVDGLIDWIESRLSNRVATIGVAMRERHRVALMLAVEHLQVAGELASDETDLADVLAEEVRSAIRAVDSIVGRVDVEHVLDEIFSSFCIGK